jgi:hypothetical protein
MTNSSSDVRCTEPDAALQALHRLITIAHRDTGQSRRVASFLLAWWNARDNGGFDLTDLWNVDEKIANDMIAVFGLAARMVHSYPDVLGYEDDFRALVVQWRHPKQRGRSTKKGCSP